ncbi:MAP1 light chain like isoform 1 [Actinidia chinensis var. chinensis]|uniref:MAP1 light chain like isoform 1 n=1 Tax=Actinidia chinensis var. chinensis TaxID=1590841 RepID=A0A2R6QXQ7_ACTCC|nr:MAP1 light chain like isoform 1 [Actinidia chinensis var. chinensis]
MALLTFVPTASEAKTQSKRRRKPQKQPSSWDQIKNLLSCKQIEGSKIHDPSKSNGGGYSKLGSCSSICSFKDVVHGNTRVVHRADNSPESSSVGQKARLLSRKAAAGGGSMSAASSRSLSGSARSHGGMQLRKLSGCYECHVIVDPSRYPSPRSRICACSECGEVFPKMESLELHQAVRHAVSELGPEDSGRNIVEIIFKSSWMKKDNPICQIERILKVRHGFRGSASDGKGVRTMASSGRAHDCLAGSDGRRAMLVCRVIAGRVRRMADDTPPEEDSVSHGLYDSVAGFAGVYSNLEELYVFNPRAILPCFVVIYKALES